MKEFLDLAISLSAVEATNSSQVIYSIRGMEALMIKEGRDKCGKTSTATTLVTVSKKV